VNDTGFRFYATDTKQLFRWDGSTWVDTAPAPPLGNDVQIAQSTSNLTLTGTMQNVPGAALTLTRPGKYLLIGCFDGFVFGASDNFVTINGQILVGGAVLAGTAEVQGPASASTATRGTVMQQWVYTLSGAAVTAVLQASKSGGGVGGSMVMSANSTLTAMWISP